MKKLQEKIGILVKEKSSGYLTIKQQLRNNE
jgi:hypothetical protein